MTVPPVLITASIAVLTVTVNAFVAFTLKFSPDAAAAKRTLRSIGLKTLEWVLNTGVVVGLLYGLFAPGPLTRAVVLEIAMGVGTLLFIVTSHFLIRVLQLQGRMLGITARHIEATKALADRLPPDASRSPK